MLSSTVLAVLKLWPVAAQAALFGPEKERRNPAVHSLVLNESTMAAQVVSRAWLLSALFSGVLYPVSSSHPGPPKFL